MQKLLFAMALVGFSLASALAPFSATPAVWAESPYQAVVLDHTTPHAIQAGKLSQVYVLVENTGSATWPAQGDVCLSYHWLDDGGNSVIYEGMRTLLPHNVAPGESVELAADVLGPDAPGHYVLQWQMVAEHIAWLAQPPDQPEITAWVQITEQPWYDSVDAEIVSHDTPDVMYCDSTTVVEVTVRNLGDVLWPTGGPVRLSYHWIAQDGRVIVQDGDRTMLYQDVDPGETITLLAKVFAPAEPATMTLQWQMIVENRAWVGDDLPSAKVQLKQRHLWNWAPSGLHGLSRGLALRFLAFALANLGHFALHTWLAMRKRGSRYERCFEALLSGLGLLYAMLHMLAFSVGLGLWRGLVLLAALDGGYAVLALWAQPAPDPKPASGTARPLRSDPSTWAIVALVLAFVVRWLLVETRKSGFGGIDALHYHIAHALHYAGGMSAWGLLPTWDVYPMSTSLLAAWLSVPLGSLSLIELSNLPLFVLLLVSMGEIARVTLGARGWRWGVLFALVLSMCEMTQAIAVFCSDMAYTAFFVAATAMALRIWHRRGLSWHDALLAAMSFGLVLSPKVSGLVALVTIGGILVLALLLRRIITGTRFGLPRHWAALAPVALMTIIACGGIWLIRNWIVYSSPLAPSGLAVGNWEIFPGWDREQQRYFWSVLADMRDRPGYDLGAELVGHINRWFGSGYLFLLAGLGGYILQAIGLAVAPDRKDARAQRRRLVFLVPVLVASGLQFWLFVRLPWSSLVRGSGLALRYLAPLFCLCGMALLFGLVPYGSRRDRLAPWTAGAAGALLVVLYLGTRPCYAHFYIRLELEALLIAAPIIGAMAWVWYRHSRLSLATLTATLAAVCLLVGYVTLANHLGSDRAIIAAHRARRLAESASFTGETGERKDDPYAQLWHAAHLVQLDAGTDLDPKRIFAFGGQPPMLYFQDATFQSRTHFINSARVTLIPQDQRSRLGDFLLLRTDQTFDWIVSHWLESSHTLKKVGPSGFFDVYRVVPATVAP